MIRGSVLMHDEEVEMGRTTSDDRRWTAAAYKTGRLRWSGSKRAYGHYGPLSCCADWPRSNTYPCLQSPRRTDLRSTPYRLAYCLLSASVASYWPLSLALSLLLARLSYAYKGLPERLISEQFCSFCTRRQLRDGFSNILFYQVEPVRHL